MVIDRQTSEDNSMKVVINGQQLESDRDLEIWIGSQYAQSIGVVCQGGEATVVIPHHPETRIEKLANGNVKLVLFSDRGQVS
jgi:anti-sigma-K factor RskA